MKIKTLVAAAVVGVAALMPSASQAATAATGGFYWSPDGGAQSASLNDPRSGHCYTLRGTHPPFYAMNATDRTARYYSSAGCSGYRGSVAPGMSGNVTRYVKFG
ncbi:hypothetical protein AB5J52_49810 (plasmid) [Streptomyces sp. R39]|uniref:Lactococcin 972 family bacteriocin n=1 Tax=Streptomyces sp. R39 TaxID=3238631 RepID=A0AB39R758_9ACTN